MNYPKRQQPAPDQENRLRQQSSANGILHGQPRLMEAARALIDIDQRGQLPELGDAIQAARREFKQRELDRTIGERLYADEMAKALSRATGLSFAVCRQAAAEAIAPSWESMALYTIVAFHAEQSAEVWR